MERRGFQLDKPLNPADAMDNTGTYNMVNGYTESLKKSSMTQKVNRLHKMCLLPFLKDLLSYEGRLRKFVTDKDKVFWNKFLSCCFAGLKFEDRSPVMNLPIYIGTANIFDAATIISNSIVYTTEQKSQLISNRVVGNYFWIALPSGYALDRAENMNFAGDAIPATGFTQTNMVLRNGNYVVYYLKARIPFKSTYRIILK